MHGYEYDPTYQEHREILAQAIFSKMEATGFQLLPWKGSNEAVFFRPVDGMTGVQILVYTSVVGGSGGIEVRRAGTDAIRVCAVYTNPKGQERGLVKADSRVNRTGHIDDIVNRMYLRMRETWKAAKCTGLCKKCGAPLFISKKGNAVCADTCWVK
jgi:hypothetical protein